MIFSKIAKWISIKLGHASAFSIATFSIIVWLILGPFFNYSDTWQLVINTGTTIVTFLMVFLIQNTQNRDTFAIQLKLDEIIRSIKGAHNRLLKIEELSDDDLQKIYDRYEELAREVKARTKNGEDDRGSPTMKSE